MDCLGRWHNHVRYRFTTFYCIRPGESWNVNSGCDIVWRWRILGSERLVCSHHFVV